MFAQAAINVCNLTTHGVTVSTPATLEIIVVRHLDGSRKLAWRQLPGGAVQSARLTPDAARHLSALLASGVDTSAASAAKPGIAETPCEDDGA